MPSPSKPIMEFTKDYKRATEIQVCIMHYRQEDIYNNELYPLYKSQIENTLNYIQEQHDANGRWPIKINISSRCENIMTHCNGVGGGQTPIGYNFIVAMHVTDNYGEKHFNDIIIAQFDMQNKLTDTHKFMKIESYSFNTGLKPLCDCDIRNRGERSPEVVYEMNTAFQESINVLTAENIALKESLSRMEKKIETMMSLMSLLK